MAIPFYDHLDGQKLAELRQFVLHKLTTPPASPAQGQVYFDTTLTQFGVWSGTAWVYLTGSLDTEAVQDIVGAMATDGDTVDFTYNDGAGTVVAEVKRKTSGLSAGSEGALGTSATGLYVVLGYTSTSAMPGNARLDQLGVPTASLDLGGFPLTNVGNPSAGTDAANKQYVDNAVQGLDAKASVRAKSAGANVSISSAPATLDGVTLTNGDRVLLVDQSAPAENGLYQFNGAGAAMTRTGDADAWAELPGAYVFVEQGTTWANTSWTCTNDQGGTLGVTAITWVQFGATGSSYTASNGVTLVGSDFRLDPDNSTVAVVGGKAAVKDGGVGTTQLADGAVTNAKAADMAADTIKGRANGAGTGDPQDLTAAQVRTIIGYVPPYVATVGDGVTLNIPVIHNLGTRDVMVEAYTAGAPYQTLYVGVQRTDVNTVTLTFNQAPAAASVRVIVRA